MVKFFIDSIGCFGTINFSIGKHFKAKFAQHFRQQPTTDPSHFSSVFESADATGNLKEDHVLDKLPERYENIDSLALITRSNTNIQYLEDIEAPQVRHVKLVEVADMVHDTFAIIEVQVFGKISHTAVSSDIHDLNVIIHEGGHFATTLAKLDDDSFCENCSLKTKVPNAVLNDTNYSNTGEEENSEDTPVAWVFDKAPQRYISGFMVPFASQGIVVPNASMRFSAIDFSLDGTLWFRTVPCLSTSLEESCGANQNMSIARMQEILEYRFLVIWPSGDTGQEFNIASGCASLPPVPLSSVSGSHTLFEATTKRWGCLFAKLYDREQLYGIEFGVEAFNAIYLNECFRVLENIEVRHIDNFLMEYEHDLPVKVLHSDDDKWNVLLEDMDLDCADIIELEKARQWRDLELIPLTNFTSLLVMPVVKSALTIIYTNFLAAKGSAYARLYNYACIRKVCNKREVVLLGDMAYICGLVSIGVIFSPFKYTIVFTCAIQFMDAKVCTPVVLEKILFAYEGFDNEKHILLVVSMLVVVERSTLDHMQFFGNIAQFGLVATDGEHASNIILDSNLEDEVLIEDGSIVMNQAHPNITHVTIGLRRAIGPKTSNRAKLIWDPG
ncbi:serine hydroxymethyltransferase, mitochondrial [Nicotiana attenuata]|uniref:Serine hydroxymethyltransferase, mitochondrial n=1 Tax=Nicotiana attenuata TaxID=49451 RepID=A0A1J6JMT1_NICAT|nr:serine hydroxymethyltransferase, mitochondrial [Nicotiana attenuata]